MDKRAPFTLIYAPTFKDNLRTIERKYHALIRQEVETKLRFEPDRESRNRKPLPGATLSEDREVWELRCGPRNRFRIFYTIRREVGEVHILAIGIKRRAQLWIGEEEIEL